jgi:hypothetical protein
LLRGFFEYADLCRPEVPALAVIIPTPSAAGDSIHEPARPPVEIARQPAIQSPYGHQKDFWRFCCAMAIGTRQTRKGAVSPTLVPGLPDFFDVKGGVHEQT